MAILTGVGALALAAQAPDPVAQPMADQVERLHREAERLRADVLVKVEMDNAVRMATRDMAAKMSADAANIAVKASMAAMWAQDKDKPGKWKGSGSSAYRRGMHSLDERKWDEAIEFFKQTDKYRPDAALYWTAFAHFKAGRSDQALLAVNTLNNSYASSPWRNDAKTLEVEVKAAQGRPVNPESLQDDEIRLIAVSGLVRSDVDKALPYLEKLVNGSQSPRVKEEALHILARTNNPKARELVIKVARSGNPDMQMKAISALGHMDSKENAATLASLYNEAKEKEVREEILDALASSRSARNLIDVAKTERDIELKKRAVRHLARMNTKESNDYLAELVK